jgi:uncharacterized protein (TIGR00255 family)
MNSMTGFGRVELKTRLGRLTVEISSLNNRFMDFSFKAPRQFSPLEAKARELIASQAGRGKVTVIVGLEESDMPPDKPVINKRVAAAYFHQLAALKKELRIAGDITMNDILGLPDVARPEEHEIDYDQYWEVLEGGIKKAMKHFVAMRRREGQAMAADMKKILITMAGQVELVERQTPAAYGTHK